MYVEGEEALFWSSPEECAAVCRDALRDDGRRRAIAAAGHARSVSNGYHNETIMRAVIEKVFAAQTGS
jgi:hypothetical protein